MPTRPVQHQIASQAVAAVTAVWTATGAACEEIRRDYGEDLLVQTCLNDEMDASRIWVQVKGTSRVFPGTNRQSRRIMISRSVIERWERTSDTVVLVLWNVRESIGHYQVISKRTPYSNPEQSPQVTVTVHRDNVFDESAARLIAMNARLDHATLQLFSLQRRLDLVRDAEDAADYAKEIKESIALLSLDVARMLGVVQRVPGQGFRVAHQFEQNLTSQLQRMTDEFGNIPVQQTTMCRDPESFYNEALFSTLLTMMLPGTVFHESLMESLMPTLRFAGRADDFVTYMTKIRNRDA